MKKSLFVYLLFALGNILNAQETYAYKGESLELIIATEGKLDFLWTTTNTGFRYFVRTDDDLIIELKNGQVTDNKSYLAVLQNLTDGRSTENLKFNKASLKRFVKHYNRVTNLGYTGDVKDEKINFRLGLFAGSTNHPLVENLVDNSSFPQFAAELELYGDTDNPRNSGLLQIRNTFGSGGDYKSLEFSLGYRFRIIKKKGFNLYVHNRFATYNTYSRDREVVLDDIITIQRQKESEFDVPFIFGIGADFKVSKNSYISFIYDRFFALNLDSNDSFPADLMIGYKFKL